MWYLYAISAIFLFAHFVHSQRSLYITLGIACVLKIVICIPPSGSVIPVPVNYLFDNLIWFTLGQAFAYRQIRWNKSVPLLLGALFVLLFIPAYVLGWSSGFLSALLTLLGVLASVGCVNILTRDKAVINGVWKYASKYMLQIYLLHTICAAGIRIVLLKIGVAHLLPHLLFGIVFSYVLPVICAVIAERVTILNVFFFPVKTVKGLLHKKQV